MSNILTEKKGINQLEQVIEKSLLEKMLFSFSKSTGLKAVLIDTEGNPIDSGEYEMKDCRFCQLIRSDDLGAKKCRRSYARAGKEAAKYGEPYIFRCHAGLIAWAAPILLEQEHVGSIICGQILMWEPEDYFLEEIEEMVKGLELDVASVKWSAAKLEVMSSDRVQAAADLLFVVANQIMRFGATVLEQRREIAAQQARLAEEIHARKHVEIAMRTIESRALRFSLDKEYTLKVKVRNCEREAAQEILNGLLIDITAKHFEHIDAVKTRIIELLVIISRATIDSGANPNDILQLNVSCYRELIDKQGTDEICLWAKSMLDIFINRVEECKDDKNLQAIQKAADYIRTNYRNKVTIDEIAQAVYLSPCYLSRIFKQNLGCTLTEYITQVRVENAKNMLKKPEYNVARVAEEIGFEDAGYFTKVFKKIEGVTPSRFKQKSL